MWLNSIQIALFLGIFCGIFIGASLVMLTLEALRSRLGRKVRSRLQWW